MIVESSERKHGSAWIGHSIASARVILRTGAVANSLSAGPASKTGLELIIAYMTTCRQPADKEST